MRGVTEEEEKEGWVDTEIERQAPKECAGQTLTGWDTESEKEGACSTWEAVASLASGGESVTGSHTGTHVDNCCYPTLVEQNEGGNSWGGERGWSQSLNERMRSIAATWLTLGISLSTCSGSLSTPAIKGTGADGERAAEIMRGTESSCGFPIFGNGSSSKSCGSTDSSRASWSCRKTRSPRSIAIYLSRDEGSIYSQGVKGTICRCCHSVECTCSQSSDGRCSVGLKSDHSSAVRCSCSSSRGGSGSGHWMTSVADEGHLDPLAETSQGRSRQELWCLCKQFLSVFTLWKLVCFFVPVHVCVMQSQVHPSVYSVGVRMARLCIAWWLWEAGCCYLL